MTTTQTPMQVTIIGPANLSGGDYVAHVHAAGCRDIARFQRANPFADSWTIPATGRRSVVEDVWGDIMGDDDSPWTAFEGNCKFYGCVDALPTEAVTA